MASVADDIGIQTAAEPATDHHARDRDALSRLTDLSLQLAEAFQAQALAALKDGRIDQASTAEASFSRLALGIRRAIALKARLQRWQDDDQRQGGRWGLRQDQVRNERRHAVARGVGRAIAATGQDVKAQDRITTDLWSRLTTDDRIDIDLDDTALSIEALILRLCRDLGLDPSWVDRPKPAAPTRGTAPAKPARTPKPWDPDFNWPVQKAPEKPETDRSAARLSTRHYRRIMATDVGRPEDERHVLGVTTGEVLDAKGKPVRILPGFPGASPPETEAETAAPGTGPPAASATPPPAPEPAATPSPEPEDPDAERRREERIRAENWQRLRLFEHIYQNRWR